MTFPPGLFRISLALIVCVSHLSRLEIGQTAVFIFFMLSGYWSLRMYQMKYAGLPNPRTTFWIARFLRIWILYVVCQVAAIMIFALVLGQYNSAYWLGTPLIGLASHGKDILGVSWSLDLEVQFYLLVPLVAALITGMARGAGLSVLVAAGAGLTVLGWWLVAQFGLVLIPAFVLPFLAGALIHARSMTVGPGLALGSLLVFLGVGAGVALHPLSHGLMDKTVTPPFDPRWFGIAWSMLLIPFVAWNVTRPSSALDRHLGNLSYSVYLVHFPFYRLFGQVWGAPSAVEKLALLALTVPVALVPYLLIDRMIELRREGWSRSIADRISPSPVRTD